MATNRGENRQAGAIEQITADGRYEEAVTAGWRDLSLAVGWGVSLEDYADSVAVVLAALKDRGL